MIGPGTEIVEIEGCRDGMHAETTMIDDHQEREICLRVVTMTAIEAVEEGHLGATAMSLRCNRDGKAKVHLRKRRSLLQT
jgi:hypothetical protein